MRRLFTTVAVCAVFFALATATAVAAMPHASVAGKQRPASARPAAGDGAPVHARFVPLGTRLAGTTTVSGYVYDSSHAALAGIDMEWDADLGSTSTYGTGLTDGSGYYSMTADATTDGDVWAYPDDGSTFARGGRTWTAGGADTVDLYPGRVNLTATRGGKWADSENSGVTLRLWGDTEYSRGTLAPAGPKLDAAGTVDMLDGTYNQGGSVKWFWDEGLEFHAPVVSVVSGATSAQSVTAGEADAQRVWISKPYWGSGKPGATITIVRNNFPAGWYNYVSGYNDDPMRTSGRDYGMKKSLGGASETVSVKIPATVKPGYRYFIGFQHVDAGGNALPLYVEEGYQVSTIKPSKTSIVKGAKIRVTGVVPTQGHWGSQLGLRKKVYLWWHKGTAPVPTTSTRGWYRVGWVKCTGTGSYKTPYFKPPATGTFVAFYAGDQDYWAAYTSAVKVKVR